MHDFQPDLAYITQEIADAYHEIQQALDGDDVALAEWWLRRMEHMVEHLDRWNRQRLIGPTK